MYRLQKQAEYFSRLSEIPDGTPPEIIIRKPEGWAWERPELLSRVSSSAAVRQEDGFGCLAITLDAVEGQRNFDVADLLSLLLIPPRTLDFDSGGSIRRECSSILRSDGRPFSPASMGKDANVSDAYILFREAIASLAATAFENPVHWHDHDPDGVYGGEMTTDPQIPYAFVEAVVDQGFYDEVFLEHRDNVQTVRSRREEYSKDIAAILARWLTPHNIPYASLDYWESRGQVVNGAFRNAYMNSLSFVAYSGLVTLVIRPEHGERLSPYPTASRELPQSAAKHSLLRCLQIARTRWHHALYLNSALDRFIEQLIQPHSTRDTLEHFSKLRYLKRSAATHLEDPFVYLWDATLGSQISEYLRQSVLDSIEKSVFKKLDLVRDILLEAVDEAKARDLARLLESK